MKRVVYECPSCKKRNPEDASHCLKCGHWLLSTYHPPKRIIKKSPAKIVLYVFLYTIGCIVGIYAILFVISEFPTTENPDINATLPAVYDTVTPEEKVIFGSRQNPVPLGTSNNVSILQYVELSDEESEYDLSIKLNEVVRGDKALAFVKEWSEFNRNPAEGYEYLLIEMNIDVLASSSHMPVNIHNNTLLLVSKNGIKYDPINLHYFDIKDGIYKELYEGASHTGWAAFELKTDDDNPLVEFVGTWFAIK